MIDFLDLLINYFCEFSINLLIKFKKNQDHPVYPEKLAENSSTFHGLHSRVCLKVPIRPCKSYLPSSKHFIPGTKQY